MDPDNNYYNHMIHHVDGCNYHDEETFKRLLQTANDINFSIFIDDFVVYLDSSEHTFSVTGLTEIWLKNENVNDFPLSQYSFVGKVRDRKLEMVQVYL